MEIEEIYKSDDVYIYILIAFSILFPLPSDASSPREREWKG